MSKFAKQNPFFIELRTAEFLKKAKTTATATAATNYQRHKNTTATTVTPTTYKQ